MFSYLKTTVLTFANSYTPRFRNLTLGRNLAMLNHEYELQSFLQY
jgi:hypothetical protein